MAGNPNAFKPVVNSIEDAAASVVSQQTPQRTLSKISGIPAQTTDPTGVGYVNPEALLNRAKLANLAAGDPNVAKFLSATTIPGIRPDKVNILPALPDITHPINKFNIPKVSPGVDFPFAEDAAAPTPPNDEEQGKFGYKVRLFAVRNFPQERVIFEVSPTLSEARTVEYAPVSPVHMPGSIQVYKRTGSRNFSIGAKFVSRNITQATQNMQYLQTLRGWTMPYFGLRTHLDQTTQTKDTGPMLGAPPDVLYLYAYSDASGANADRDGAFQTNLKKIPVVITNLSFDYPEDVDYIPTANGDPFPVKMEVKIDLSETHSPKGYEEFSLGLFKQGKLVQF